MSNVGVIYKAISGFYYVDMNGELLSCRAPGRFRYDGVTPLVGDRVLCADSGDGTGVLTEVLPRKNEFLRPSVSNLDQLLIVASASIPCTDPFLIDRQVAVAEHRSCVPVVCINKCDLNMGDELFEIYRKVGLPVLRISAETGEGLGELREILNGKVSAFTGNSGVGKSSILNALEPAFHIPVGELSVKLGRGRHTTRHVELMRLPGNTFVVDTPGFSSFDAEQGAGIKKEELQFLFREFEPYLNQCRFQDCSHGKETGCAVLAALERGELGPTRHQSYLRLYELSKQQKDWEK